MYSTVIQAHSWRSCTTIRAAKAMVKAQIETPMTHTTRDGRKNKYKGKRRDVPKHFDCNRTLNILQSPWPIVECSPLNIHHLLSHRSHQVNQSIAVMNVRFMSGSADNFFQTKLSSSRGNTLKNSPRSQIQAKHVQETRTWLFLPS